MKNFINNNWYKIIAALILFIAIGDHPYSYYQLTRWVTCIASFYAAYTYHNAQKTWLMWLFIALGILFNPIAPFYLEKETWQVFNLIGAALFTVSVFVNKNTTKSQIKKQKTETSITNQVQAVYSEIDKIWDKDLDLNSKSTNSLIKTDKTYLIPPTDGKENISNSPGIFKLVFLDKEEIQKSNFVSKSTDPINASVYMQINDSTIYKMFKSFGDDLNVICFTQSQILTFLNKYKHELVGTWHFLFKAKDEFMFMQVCMDDDSSMRLFGGDFSEDGLNYVYPATGVNFRFLVPEIKTELDI